MDILEKLANLMLQYSYIGVLLAFLAGVIASFSPCTLSAVSLLVTYNTNKHKTRKALFFSSLIYCLGLAITTSAIVVVFVIVSSAIQTAAEIWEKIWICIMAGIMLFMALFTFGIFKKRKHKKESSCTCASCEAHKKVEKRTKLNIFLLGLLGGVICAPCMAPIILATVSLVTTTHSLAFGILIYIFYLLGHILVILLGALFFAVFVYLSQNAQNKKWRVTLNIIVGILFLIFAALLILGVFFE